MFFRIEKVAEKCHNITWTFNHWHRLAKNIVGGKDNGRKRVIITDESFSIIWGTWVVLIFEVWFLNEASPNFVSTNDKNITKNLKSVRQYLEVVTTQDFKLWSQNDFGCMCILFNLKKLEVWLVTSFKRLPKTRYTWRFTISKPLDTNSQCSKCVRLSLKFLRYQVQILPVDKNYFLFTRPHYRLWLALWSWGSSRVSVRVSLALSVYTVA